MDSVSIECEVSYGMYCWCCNYKESGMFASKPAGSKLTYYTPKSTYMLRMSFNMTEEFCQSIDLIRVVDGRRRDIQHSVSKLLPNHQFFFPIDEELIGANVDVRFVKCLPREEGASPFSPPPFEIKHSETVNVGDIKRFSDTDECPVCMEPIEKDNVFIGQCGHSICSGCFWQMAEAKNQVKPLDENCSRCSHSGKLKIAQCCPICRADMK